MGHYDANREFYEQEKKLKKKNTKRKNVRVKPVRVGRFEFREDESIPEPLPMVSYLVVATKGNSVLLGTDDYDEARKLVENIEQAGGDATVYEPVL